MFLTHGVGLVKIVQKVNTKEIWHV